MSKEDIFRVVIRIVFLFAYGAFLWASLRHMATFFHNFEPAGSDWTNAYTLAVSIDVTSLMLTIGVMFFRKNMPWYAITVIWLFIIALTGFSWFVNWEYANRYQGHDLTADPTLKMINPVLASSFAFLNLAYSVVAEFFNARVKTVEEVSAELARLEELEQVEKRLHEYRLRNKKPGLIQRAKEKAIEVKQAAKEVITEEQKQTVSPALPSDKFAEEEKSHEPEEVHNQFDTEDVIPTDNEPVNHPQPIVLGMVENIMYERIMEQPAVRQELLHMAQTMGIPELTEALAKRFSSHANYITQGRVANVWAFIKENHPDLFLREREGKHSSLQDGRTTNVPTNPSREEIGGDVEEAPLPRSRQIQEPTEEREQEPGRGVTRKVTQPLAGTQREEREPSRGEIQGRQTDPQMEALNVTTFPGQGNTTEIDLPPIDITTRRKPLTVKEVGEVLGVTEKTVRAWRAKGDLKAPEEGSSLITAASVRAVLQVRGRREKVS